MESKQTGRVILILCVLAAAVFAICPHPARLFAPGSLAEKTNLRPGIDMAGGTSLLYQIREPSGGYHPSNGNTLAEDEVTALKRRVDPSGIKNLIWRPQGTNRLEIQIPASPQNDEAIAKRAAYVAASRKLEATNVSEAAVRAAVEQLRGDARQARLDALVGGIDIRRPLFQQLVVKYDAVQAAKAVHDADAQARASDDYDKLVALVDQTNLRPADVENVLADPPETRAKELADLTKSAAADPARATALAEFVAAADVYDAIKSKVDDAAQLKRELQGSGVLEFHILATASNGLTEAEYERMARQLREKGPRPQAGDQLAWFQIDRPDQYGYRRDAPPTSFNGKEYALCWITPERSMVNGPGIQRWSMESAGRQADERGGMAVSFTFDTVGGFLFHTFTANNVNRPLAAILDRRIVSAANINTAIGRQGQISSGNGYSDEELAYLVDTLNAGSLPAQLEDEPISEQTVGPELGKDNLLKGLNACGFGLVIVAIFLISYYYLAGLVATVAVLLNVVLILGVLAAFGATFTLPGIAGIVLTIGAAVDANVLIFERLREEQHRGLGLKMAMANAYTHAQTAILDSNATTVITSLILIWLGSEEVKGFGTTLLIGLISSLFTSLFVTRTVFNILIDTFHVKNLSSFPLTFPKWDRFLKPDIDWMGKVKYFLAFSGLFILLGGVAFVAKSHEGKLADVDFTGGTQVQFELRQPTSLQDVRNLFAVADNTVLGKEPDLTGAGSGDVSYRLVTPNQDAKAVRQAVLDVLKDRVTIDLPSRFDHLGEPIDAALADKSVLPVPSSGVTVGDYKVPGTDEYIGGVAIVMNDVQPPLTLEAIRNRLDQQRAQQQATAGANGPVFHDFTVVSPDTTGGPVKTAVVLTADPQYPYDKDPAKWTANVADPMWRLTIDAVSSSGSLQGVNNFDAQVAGDTQATALYALILSAVVILAYVWLRFGSLKYGTATVLAMLHDVALVVGAVGLSHYIAEVPWLAKLLLVEPFRVNLTIVAAVLTVMSYSMIDTIVVFDRIRENRGRFGHLNRQVVNDSINQTLSRTLLTAGTTIVTVAGMYVVGGPGIHGFTFVLLVGILVGTYSSIAIAAPILLTGADSGGPVDRRTPAGALAGTAG
jgi:SecD/SecF fusion protein